MYGVDVRYRHGNGFVFWIMYECWRRCLVWGKYYGGIGRKLINEGGGCQLTVNGGS